MELAVAISAHPDRPELIIDTIDSILTYGTEKILMIVDAVGWHRYKDIPLPVSKLEGFRHGAPKAPYRNVALALKVLTETWPDADWYCYCDDDVLFGSERFKHNLKMAEDKDVWMLGNDGHVDEQAMPLIQALIGAPIKSSYYLLGCLHFFHRKFIDKLNEINFFERFLTLTSGFDKGFFPLYSGWDISEHMYPSLCRHFGGNIGVFATWEGETQKWHGAYEYFPLRWKPELDPETENFADASILHPLKTVDHPLRDQFRRKREQWKDLQKKAKQSVSC
jgi:hypothetical protein